MIHRANQVISQDKIQKIQYYCDCGKEKLETIKARDLIITVQKMEKDM